MAPDADLVALVKPMFELGLAGLPVGSTHVADALIHASDGIEATGRWHLVASMDSPVRGAKGARECLVHARRREAV